jgi:hypothetical protein
LSSVIDKLIAIIKNIIKLSTVEPDCLVKIE